MLVPASEGGVHRHSVLRRAVLAFVALLPALSAQRTWIVDAAGGPGVHFTELPPAVLAAASGDRILIRPAASSYTATTIHRGIRLVATGVGVSVGSGALTVQNVVAGERCTISGIFPDRLTSLLRVDACAGSVVVTGLAGGLQGVAVVVTRSAAVRFESCWVEFERRAALEVEDSTVLCVDSLVRGLDEFPICLPLPAASKGIWSYQSRVTLIVIEHHLDVIKCADHVLEMGPEAGAKGGKIVAQGTPEAVAASKCHIARFLREALARRVESRPRDAAVEAEG